MRNVNGTGQNVNSRARAAARADSAPEGSFGVCIAPNMAVARVGRLAAWAGNLQNRNDKSWARRNGLNRRTPRACLIALLGRGGGVLLLIS